MKDLIEEKDNVLSFTLFKVEKGREKICRCNPPHYVIDTTNRIVTCEDCGATLDAFDALLASYYYMNRYEDYQKKALKKAETYREFADKEWRRRMKNKAFKEMDAQYHSGMLPYCPRCEELFDPTKITRWGNKALEIVKEGAE